MFKCSIGLVYFLLGGIHSSNVHSPMKVNKKGAPLSGKYQFFSWLTFKRFEGLHICILYSEYHCHPRKGIVWNPLSIPFTYDILLLVSEKESFFNLMGACLFLLQGQLPGHPVLPQTFGRFRIHVNFSPTIQEVAWVGLLVDRILELLESRFLIFAGLLHIPGGAGLSCNNNVHRNIWGWMAQRCKDWDLEHSWGTVMKEFWITLVMYNLINTAMYLVGVVTVHFNHILCFVWIYYKHLGPSSWGGVWTL